MRILIALSLAVLMAGCGPTSQPRPAPTPTTAPTPTMAAAAPFCQVPLPAAWQAALDAGRVAVPAGAGLVVMAAAADGSSVFAQVNRPGSSELDWLNGQSRTTVMRLDDPVNQQFIAGGFDGRWLVFGIRYDLSLVDEWNVYAWDSHSGGDPRKIADNRAGVPGPWIMPVVGHGKAAWIQGTAGRQSDVHLYDLATGTDRVVQRTPATGVFFTDSWLVWRDGYADGSPVHLKAVDAATAEPVTLPPALADAQSSHYANGDGQTLVWDHNGALLGWRPQWTNPRLILADRNAIEWPYVGSDLVSFGNTLAYFVADLRSGSYTQVTPQYGYVQTFGDALVVMYYNPDKSATGPTSVVRASALPPLPSCA
jgi:hypothetical protein